MNKHILSIVIVTMNRQRQVIDALRSCINCKLPVGTVFVIIDNASSDNTENEIKRFFDKQLDMSYIYKKMEANVGAGMGRNIGFKSTESKYVFFLDDDAVIDENNEKDFFMEAITILENNPSIATLTTQIYDVALKGIRNVKISKSFKIKNIHTIFLIHGGSCFFRRSSYDATPFPDIRYGFEELYPSIINIENNFVNAYTDSLRVIHKPEVNKWKNDSELLTGIIIKGNAGLLTVKYLLFPQYFYPILYAAFFARWFKYLRKEKGSFKRSYELFKKQRKDNILLKKKIKVRTVFKIFKEFGFGAGV